MLLLMQISTKVHTYRKLRAGQLCLRESGRRTQIGGPAEIYAMNLPLKTSSLDLGSQLLRLHDTAMICGSTDSVRAQYRWNFRATQGVIGDRSNTSRAPCFTRKVDFHSGHGLLLPLKAALYIAH